MKAARRTIITAGIDPALMQAIRKAPMLSREREYELALAWRERKDAAALKELTTAYLKLTLGIAHGFKNYGLPIDDLVQEGSVGMMLAAERFDPGMGFRFSTYAHWQIRASIAEYVLANVSATRFATTARYKKLFFKVRRVRTRIEQANPHLSRDEINEIAARELEVEPEDVAAILAVLSPTLSLSAPIGDEDGDTFGDLLESKEAPIDDVVADRQRLAIGRDALDQALATLSDRDRTIFVARRLTDPPQTLEELAIRFRLSRERVRQLEARAFERVSAMVRNTSGFRGESGAPRTVREMRALEREAAPKRRGAPRRADRPEPPPAVLPPLAAPATLFPSRPTLPPAVAPVARPPSAPAKPAATPTTANPHAGSPSTKPVTASPAARPPIALAESAAAPSAPPPPGGPAPVVAHPVPPSTRRVRDADETRLLALWRSTPGERRRLGPDAAGAAPHAAEGEAEVRLLIAWRHTSPALRAEILGTAIAPPERTRPEALSSAPAAPTPSATVPEPAPATDTRPVDGRPASPGGVRAVLAARAASTESAPPSAPAATPTAPPEPAVMPVGSPADDTRTARDPAEESLLAAWRLASLESRMAALRALSGLSVVQEDPAPKAASEVRVVRRRIEGNRKAPAVAKHAPAEVRRPASELAANHRGTTSAALRPAAGKPGAATKSTALAATARQAAAPARTAPRPATQPAATPVKAAKPSGSVWSPKDIKW